LKNDTGVKTATKFYITEKDLTPDKGPTVITFELPTAQLLIQWKKEATAGNQQSSRLHQIVVSCNFVGTSCRLVIEAVKQRGQGQTV